MEDEILQYKYHSSCGTEFPFTYAFPQPKMLNHIIVNAYNFWVVVLAAVGTISTAYGLAIIGSTVGQPNFYTFFNLAPQGEPGYAHTANIIAALNGVNSAGAIVGCGYHVWSSERYGRKWTMVVSSVILIIGGALCAGAVNMAMFIVGRGVAGMVSIKIPLASIW